MVHSFYAGMGGFVFDPPDRTLEKAAPFIQSHRRLHVTPRGVQLLARCGLLPRITTGDIMDKSKTDGSGKVICCAQVLWMVIQAITRVAVDLPVTPLETNTIGHVVCALINYILWWNKPRWIKEPTVLRGEWTQPMCAFMYMSSQVSAEHRVDRDLLRDFGVRAEMASVLYLSGDKKKPASCEVASQEAGRPMPRDSCTSQSSSTAVQTPSNSRPLFDSQAKRGHMVPRSNFDHRSEQQNVTEEAVTEVAEQVRQRRWYLACKALHRHQALRERLEPKELNEDDLRYRDALRLYPEMPDRVKQQFERRCDEESSVAGAWPREAMVCRSEELVVERPRNWPGDDLVRDMQGHLMGMVLWNASTIYGAIHLAGWNEIFPTALESWFWKASAMYIIFSGVLWSLLNLLGHMSGKIWWYWYEILAGGKSRRSHVLLYVLCAIGGILYVVARTYLVVEAFVSVRALPAAAYQSPSWVLTVPHV